MRSGYRVLDSIIVATSLFNYTSKLIIPLQMNYMWPQSQDVASLLLNTTGANHRFVSTHTYPRISIVIPSFNQGNYLGECIGSILDQGYPNLDLVVMDGGSSDNSVSIIKKYERYLSYWQSQPDGGHYTALNSGFLHTSGEIMGWLNSDDRFHSNGLFTIAEVFSKRADVEWITGHRVGFDAESRLQSYGFETQRWCRDMLLDGDNVKPPVVLTVMQEATYWRRSLWERAGGGIKANYSYAADFELWCRFSRFAQLHTVDAKIAGFRVHSAEQRSYRVGNTYLEEAMQICELESAHRSVNPQFDNTPPPLIRFPINSARKSLCTPTVKVKFDSASPVTKASEDLPKLTVVTPCFNQGKFIQECIESVLGQGYKNLEYIVIDGGSTDGSVNIIRKYEKYLHYWESLSLETPFQALNRGFKQSSGELMAAISADNVYQPYAFESISRIFKTYPTVSWLTGRRNSIDEDGYCNSIDWFTPVYKREMYLNGHFIDPSISSSSVFWRRKLWEVAGGHYVENWKFAADVDLWRRFYRYERLYSVNALLSSEREHDDQRSKLYARKYILEGKSIVAEEKNLFSAGTFPFLPTPPQVIMSIPKA